MQRAQSYLFVKETVFTVRGSDDSIVFTFQHRR